MLCSLVSKKHLLSESTGNTQEAVAPSWHDKKIVYWGFRNIVHVSNKKKKSHMY